MEFRNETDILIEMIEQAVQTGLITNTDDLIAQIREGKQTENQYILDLSAHAYILSQLEQIAKDTYKNVNIATAEGEALDNFGLFLNVARYPAKPAVVEVKLSVPLLDAEDVTIPQGTPLVVAQSMGSYGEYVLSETVTVPAGVESLTTTAENVVGGVTVPLPAHACVSVLGYNINAINEEKGTTGSNIEEDDDYRIRLLNWASKNRTGTRACIEDYLDHYEGVGSYNLIPLFEGVGTLKIVCDTLQSLTERIAEDVYTNCMNFTDVLPTVELPVEEELPSIHLCVTKSKDCAISEEELSTLLVSQTYVFIHGGTTRNGRTIKGMNIGDDFIPSHLEKFLLDQFIEVDNLYLEKNNNLLPPTFEPFNKVLFVDDNAILRISDVQVVFE